MSARVATFATAAVLLLLAAGLRFYHLGAWQYAGDELAAVDEERVLFHAAPAPRDSQEYRLPHAVPLGYLAIHVSHTLFGDGERGTRVVSALLGTLSVVLVFLLFDGPRITAMVTAALVALMPAHVLFSQMTRFYMVACFLSFAALLTGARITGPRGTTFAALACCLAFLAALAHSVLIALLPLIFIAMCAGFCAQRRAVSRAVWLVFALATLVTIAFVALYLWPLLRGWNQGEAWGYSPTHAVLASVVMLGWSTTLLAAVGFLLMLRERSAQSWYWSVCALGWLGASVTLPLVVTYHPGYVFALSLGALVAAAYAITVIFDLLRVRAPVAAWVWLGLSCLVNLPALASYYVDGSRNDIRGAATYVRAHWASGDRVTAYTVGAFSHYSDACCEPAIPLPQGAGAPAQLAQLAATDGRLWIVLENKRPGLEPALQKWLFDCAVHKLSLGGRRFDDEEFKEEVYLVSPPVNGACAARPDAPHS